MSYLQVKNVVKSFGNNKVLENISIDFEKGEIHSIIGENGAGKSHPDENNRKVYTRLTVEKYSWTDGT